MRCRSPFVVFAGAVALAAVSMFAVADEAPPSAARALRAAETALRDRDWAKAATDLHAVRAQFPAAPEADEAWVLEARALLLAGAPRPALDAATAFLAARGDAAWAGRMKATMADAYAALKAPADEVRVLRERAEFLTGDDYRGKIAALYVAMGDQDFDGRDAKDDLGRPVKQKDLAAALAAYGQALRVGVVPADVLRVRARLAATLEALGRPGEAISVWDALVRDDVAGPGADPEAWLVGRARARLAAGQRPEARVDLRDAQQRFPHGARALEVLRLLAAERFASVDGAGEQEMALAYEEGITFLRQAVVEHRDAPDAAVVARELATRLSEVGQHEKAAAEWRALRARFPSDAAAPAWLDALATELASAGKHDEAVRAWQEFLAAYPNDPRWADVQARIPLAKLAKGTMFAEQRDLPAAVAAWRAFVDEFPTHALAPAALVDAGTLLREQKDFEGAIATWRGVTGRYAATPQATVAWVAIAVTLEDDLGRLDDAVKEYEALVKQHPDAAEATRRLARLKGKHVEVRGDRVVGTAEPSVLRVVTRNVAVLRVRVYKLGLEDYFRRKQTVLGVEGLQVEVVKPDATVEWKLDPYTPFALLSAERPVPTTGPGAYVVLVGDDDLTATTLLLVSDVEAVVKSAAGRQVFVWARSRTTGAPVEGARVLASDGTAIFAEGTTDKDGVWMLDTDKTARRVLVVKDGHAAAGEWEPGAVFAEGYSSKIHIATDRPVYRPGQTVAFRAIYRQADGGGYVVPAGAKARASLHDPRGVEIERKDVVATAMGTFSGEFALDAEAPLGEWSVWIELQEAQQTLTMTGGFRVLEYRRPEFSVAVTPEKPSYKTGEQGKATIRLAYTFGGPVVGAPVRWQVVRVPRDFTPSAVDDYRWYFQDAESLERARRAAREAPQGALVARGEATTDAKGEAVVTFATQERDDDAEYVVVASAIDVTRRFVSDEGRIPVVRRDHWAVVRTDRKVYRPAQEVRATFTTVNANQTPVGKAGDAIVVRVRRAPALRGEGGPQVYRMQDGKPVAVRLEEEEVEVSRLPVATDEKGRAEVRLPAPKAGTYRMRWSSLDARGGVVTAYATFDVAGDAEDLAKDVRLVAAKETYVEGEHAEVLLQSPVTHVRALLTFEGEKVLGYRLVDVDGPSALLDVAMEGRFAPNVVLKVAVPAKDRLLEAEDEVVVFRYLEVAVTPSAREGKPGDEVRFDVTTTDAAGKPVPAEVGVSVVDEALFGIAPDLSPAIRPFFYDRRRVNRVVTSSSVGYRTYGTTRATNKDVLADAAARSGDPAAMASQGALRLAREALQRGDVTTAVAQACAAADLDPSSWDARNLVSELRERGDAQGAFQQVDHASAYRRQVVATMAEERAGEANGPAALPPPPGAVPMPSAPALRATVPGRYGAQPGKDAAKQLACGAGKCGGGDEPGMAEKDAEFDDHNETDDDLAVAENADLRQRAAEDTGSTLGSGGGEGGGKAQGLGARRGGGRTVSRRGGKAAAGGYFLEGGDGDFRGRAEQVFVLNKSAWVADYDVEIAQAANLANPVAGALPAALRRTFADTAAFLPAVATDGSGKGSFTVKLPDNLTTWRATVRGVSGSSLVGEGRASVVARRDLLLRVDAPRFLVQGDRATIPAVVHNGTGAEVTATVRVKAEGATVAGEDGDVVVPAQGRGLRDRDVAVAGPGAVRLEVEATASSGADRVEALFPALPRGLRVVDGRSGSISTAAGDVVETFVELPEGAIPGATRLTVSLYPGLDSAIVDGVVALELFPYGCVEQTVHRLLPAAWARRALLAMGSPDAKRFADLDRTIAASVGRLRNLAHDDGSYGWWRGGRGDAAMTALALLALAQARDAGVAAAGTEIDRTAGALVPLLRAAPDDVQALCHWALAAAGRIDEEAYQVTFRRRNEELSPAGLAWMAFAAHLRDRAFDADELVRLLTTRRIEDADGTTHWPARAGDCFVGSEALTTALAVRALVLLTAEGDAAERGLRWLLAHVRPATATTMETAAYVGALAAWVEKARPAAFGGRVRVLVDGAEVRAVAIPAGAPLEVRDRRFVLDASSWKPGRHALAFRLEGQGELRYAARLETTVAAETFAADEHGLAIERLYLDPEVPGVEGAELPPKPGYECLRPAARPKVEAKSRATASSGERILVRLVVRAPRDLRFVTVEDPLPAGFEVLDTTAAGPFAWEERRDDRQVFFLSDVKAGTVVLSYVLQAVHPGRFTALPARAAALYLPEVHGHSTGHVFAVSATPTPRDGEAGPTPDEALGGARRLLAAKRYADAATAFAALRLLPLLDEVVVECEAALLTCAIEAGAPKDADAAAQRAKEIVRAREELVRRDPSAVPGDLRARRAIAGAYADIGAHGVAATLYRDLVAGAFGLEAGWAKTLASRGREVEGLAVVATALRAAPIGNAAAAAALERATRLRDVARPAGGTLPAGRPMDAESVDALRDVAAHFAETALADPASYALIDGLRRVRDVDAALDEATAFPRRFPASAFVDDALYFLAEARWAKLETAPAGDGARPAAAAVVDAAQRLIDWRWKQPDGVEVASEFRPRAWHLLGRARHVGGDLAGAIVAYREAAAQVEDARESLAWLTDARLTLPESVVAPVAGAAAFPLTYRNVGAVAFRVYPVDLQVLFAMRRTLEGLNRIDLSGITPATTWTLTPAGGDDHGAHTLAVDLPMGKDAAGVFLVVAKAGELEASTVVVKTDLAATLQRLGEKVRVNVTDAAGKGVRGAFVTVSDGTSIKVRGVTDARGVLEAPGVGATPFVVVNVGDRYAVAR